MTVTEFYVATNGDYKDAKARIPKPERLLRFIKMFAENDDYPAMMNAIRERNWLSAFRHIHNLKGMALNLGFSKLSKSGTELCESIRPGVAPQADISPLLAAVERDHSELLAIIPEVG